MAGIFVWTTILLFLISLFILGYFARRESDRLTMIAEEENFESTENSAYYNAENLHYISWGSYILGAVFVVLVLGNLSTISLSIAVIKSAALFIASNFWIILIPIFFAIIALIYVIKWVVVLGFLWSSGEMK